MTSENNIFPQTSTTSTTGHITRQDERELLSGDSHIGSPRMSASIFSKSVAENYMDPRAIFASPIRLGSVEWDTTQAAGTSFLNFLLPEAFVINDTFHKTLLSLYTFYKPDIEVWIETNSTAQHMGLLRLWYDPFQTFKDAVTPAPVYTGNPQPRQPNIFGTSMASHVDLQARESNKVSLRVRYEHPQQCLTTNSIDPISNMGKINVQIVNPLQTTPTSSNSVTVQMWLRFVTCEVALPIWPHTPLIPSSDFAVLDMQSDTTPEPAVRESTYNVVESSVGIPEVGPPKTSPKRSWWEKGLSIGGGIAGAVWNGVTGNWGGAASNIINTIKDIFTMDKPSDPMRSVPNMIFPVTPLAHMQGVGGSVRLDASPIGGYLPTDISSSDPIEHKFATLMKIPSMFGQFSWSNTDAPGKLLATYPVVPGLCNYTTLTGQQYYAIDGSVQNNGTIVVRDHTYLSYYSSFFRYWSGSIKFKYQFVTTGLHTGKIAVIFIPNNYDQRGLQTLPQSTCANTEIFDVAGESNFEFTPGWVSATPRKSWYDWAGQPYSRVDDRTLYGWIEIRVVGRLTTTNAIPATVTCNQYISAGDDFFCEFPMRDPTLFPEGQLIPTTVSPPPPPSAAYTDYEVLDVQAAEDEPAHYQAEPGAVKVNNMHSMPPSPMTNQTVGDVRDVCRRAGFQGIYPMPLRKDSNGIYTASFGIRTSPANTGKATNLVARDPINSLYLNPSQDMLNCIARSFIFYSGSMDYTFIPYTSNTNIHLSAFYYPMFEDDIDIVPATQYALGSAYASTPKHITVGGQQNALQVSCPFTSNYQQLAIQSINSYNPEVYNSGVLWLYVTTTDVAGLPVDADSNPILYVEIYRTLGDDGRFSWVMTPPRESTFQGTS